jgi:hypothetical protein
MDADQQIRSLDALIDALDSAASADEVMAISRRWHPRRQWGKQLAAELIYDAWRAFQT